MKSLHSFLAGVALTPALLAAQSSTSTARQESSDLSPTVSVSTDGIDVLYDEPGDGRIWARGARYKASFGAEGARYIASFGPRQPSSAPHVLSPDSVTSGGELVAFDSCVNASRTGDRVQFDRGAFVEIYELAPDSMEQLFVFDALPTRADLVLHIPIASDLEGVETDAGLEFRGKFGHIAYSRAVAIDRNGRRAVAATHLEDGAITIRVGAEFLATAELPLVIDPLLQQFWIDSTTTITGAPDIAWDPFHQVWVAVYEEQFSATDIDMRARAYNSSGVFLSEAAVDLSTASWRRPRIANNGSAHVFLVVAELTSSTPRGVIGRIVQPNGTILTTSSPINGIGGSASGDRFTPTVGGDSSLSGSTFFCVAFERTISPTDSSIMTRLISPTGQFASSEPFAVADPELRRDRQPSLSRTNNGAPWLLAWVHNAASTSDDIWCTTVGLGGAPLHDPVVVTSGTVLDTNPCVSSPLLHAQRSAIAFQRRLPDHQADFDVCVSVVDYTQPLPSVVLPTVIQTVNLTFDSGILQTPKNQIEPSVDSDGRHFVVAYTEPNPPFVSNVIFAHDLYLADTRIGTSQHHVEIHPMLGLEQRNSRVAAARAPTSQAQKFGIIYDVGSGASDVSARLFESVQGGATSTVCRGDGTQGACPCGNNGVAGSGCGNSIGAGGGAVLNVFGTPSTTTDSLRLQASGMPAGTSCLFFQGTTVDVPTPFGDGLRCIGGTLVRLIVKTAPGGVAQTPAPGSGEPALSSAGMVPIGGGTRSYQVWYRDASTFCTSATFNLTNGILADWAP
ncbi:MAG: hypothetical protein JNL28_05745 [Planctomycetes bacterium]|nr:hypothetical protein [Planctomycetota bacterium]